MAIQVVSYISADERIRRAKNRSEYRRDHNLPPPTRHKHDSRSVQRKVYPVGNYEQYVALGLIKVKSERKAKSGS